MKKIRIILVNILLIFVLASCDRASLNSYEQSVVEEDTMYIDNPDQGFYSPVCIQVVDDFKDKDYVINDKTRLYHLRMDLSAFSQKFNNQEDMLLRDKDLNNIDAMMSKYLKKEKNVIIRFAYDHNYEGKKDQEPSISIWVAKISSALPVCSMSPMASCLARLYSGSSELRYQAGLGLSPVT